METLYSLFDLQVKCEEHLFAPSIPSEGGGDTIIKVRFVHEPTLEINANSIQVESTPTKTLFNIPALGIFEILGDSIEVRHSNLLNPIEKTVLLSEAVLPFYLALQGCLVLHASAVSESGIGKCFIGPSGSGKSTRAALSLLNQHSILAQDVTVLRLSKTNNSIAILAGSPFISLRSESAEYCSRFNEPFGVSEGKTLFKVPLPKAARLSELNLLESFDGPRENLPSHDFFASFMKSVLLPKFYMETMPHHFMNFLGTIFRDVKFSRVRHDSYSHFPSDYKITSHLSL